MDNYNDTTLSRKNKHLNAYERGQIQLLNSEGFTPYAIGKRLGRASNTIRNELKRGTVPQIKGTKKIDIYLPDAGQAVYEKNRLNSRKPFKLLTCQCFITHVESEMRTKKHSVDAICGRAKLTGMFNDEALLSTKTIYNYIDIGLMTIKNIDLPLKVKRTTKGRRVRIHKKVLGTSISERPESINSRSDFGHWEVDLVIGRKTVGESVLLTLTERKTHKEIIRKLPEKSASSVLEALNKLALEAGELFPQVFKSITADNGSEFAELSSFVYSDVYFAHPYSSYERGTNEHNNGLIRRFIPKGISMNGYASKAIETIQHWCNSLPRKILGYLTPDEAFEQELMKIAYQFTKYYRKQISSICYCNLGNCIIIIVDDVSLDYELRFYLHSFLEDYA